MIATETTAPERLLELIPEEAQREELRGLRRFAGGEWLVATNGILLIAENSDREVPEFENLKTPAEVFLALLDPTSPSLGTRPVESLRRWAGKPEVNRISDPCEECDATGQDDEGLPCLECDGAGKWTYWDFGERREKTISGANFDLCLVALCAAVLPSDGFVTLHVLPHGIGSALIGVCGDVRMLVMSLVPPLSTTDSEH